MNGGVGTQGYIRSITAHNNSSVHWAGLLNNLSITDVLTITAEQEAAAGTVTVQVGKKGSLLVHKIDADTRSISARGVNVVAGANWNQNSLSSAEWIFQDEYDTGYFSHDPLGSNKDEITIQTAGDYLLVFNASFTSSVQRGAPKLQVYINGVAVPGAIGASNFIRASSGHDEGSSSFSHYLKDLQIGDIITIRSIREAQSGSVTALDDAKVFIINYPF